MAQYGVTHSCGHTHTHQLYGKHTERERRIAWLSTQDCPECRETKFRAACEAENEAAAQTAEQQNLPLLTGSEKQVAWANSIRVRMLAALPAALETMRTKTAKGAEKGGIHADLAAAVNASADVFAGQMYLQGAAKWWIDNRDTSVDALLLSHLRKDAEVARLNEAMKAELAEQKAVAGGAK